MSPKLRLSVRKKAKSLLQWQKEAPHLEEPGRCQRAHPASYLHGSRARPHDFALYQRSNLEVHESLEVLADSGYQGLSKLHEKSRTLQKKPRQSELTDEQKQSNRELARRRVVVEHVIRSLKIFRILAERYRNRRQRFSLRFDLIAGLHNFELSLG